MTNDWDYMENSSEVWFDELIIGHKYKFALPIWFQEMNKQFEQKNDKITLTAISVGKQQLKNGKILEDKEDIILSLWRPIYDKWKKAKKIEIEKNKPVIIELIKISQRKWSIITIINYFKAI